MTNNRVILVLVGAMLLIASCAQPTQPVVVLDDFTTEFSAKGQLTIEELERRVAALEELNVDKSDKSDKNSETVLELKRRIAFLEDVDISNMGFSSLSYYRESRREFSKHLRLLIEADTDVKAFDKFGYTTLHHAASLGDAKLIKSLIDAGADVNADIEAESKTKGGRYIFGVITPLSCYTKDSPYDDPDIVKLLIDNGASPVPLGGAIQNRKPKTIKALIDAGADVKASGILYNAVLMGDSGVVKALIDAGADVKKDSELLHEAIQRGYVDITKLLIESGADVLEKDRYGYTPRMTLNDESLITGMDKAQEAEIDALLDAAEKKQSRDAE